MVKIVLAVEFGILALIFICGLFKRIDRYISLKRDMETEKQEKMVRLHEQENENWRQVPAALARRIYELENTCKENQKKIGELKLELENKNAFLNSFRLKDLYEKDLYEKDGDCYFLIWEAKI